MHQIPSSLPPLFSGDRLVVYGLLKPSENASQDGKNEVSLQGALGKDEKMEHLIMFSTPPMVPACDIDLSSSVFLHHLAAKAFIKVKQDNIGGMLEIEDDKTSIISTSKSANVVSKFTSFVAVDKDNHEPVSGPLTKEVIPSFGHPDVSQMCSQMGYAPSSSCGFAFGFGAQCASSAPGAASHKRKAATQVLTLISLQKASGAWELTDKLVSLCCTSRDALITGCPAEIAVNKADGKLLWATALALVLLMGKFLDQKDEWEMIAEKGKKWMKKNLPAAMVYDRVLEAAATAVGVQI